MRELHSELQRAEHLCGLAGNWKKVTCTVDINRFARLNDTVFYEPYFVDTDGSLCSIPVFMQDYWTGSTSVDVGSPGFPYSVDEIPGIGYLTLKKTVTTDGFKKFFIVDNLSGRLSILLNFSRVGVGVGRISARVSARMSARISARENRS